MQHIEYTSYTYKICDWSVWKLVEISTNQLSAYTGSLLNDLEPSFVLGNWLIFYQNIFMINF